MVSVSGRKKGEVWYMYRGFVTFVSLEYMNVPDDTFSNLSDYFDDREGAQDAIDTEMQKLLEDRGELIQHEEHGPTIRMGPTPQGVQYDHCLRYWELIECRKL